MKILMTAVAVLALTSVASAQNLAPQDYVYNAAKVRWERPGQPERSQEAPGDNGSSADSAGDSGASSGEGTCK